MHDPIYFDHMAEERELTFAANDAPESVGRRIFNVVGIGLGFLAALALVSGVVWGVCWI